MNNKQHTLFVCTTCASLWQDGKRIGESGGQQLLQQLQQLAFKEAFWSGKLEAESLLQTVRQVESSNWK